MLKDELLELPKSFTILFCSHCGKGQGYIIKKEGLCPSCKTPLITLHRG